MQARLLFLFLSLMVLIGLPFSFESVVQSEPTARAQPKKLLTVPKDDPLPDGALARLGTLRPVASDLVVHPDGKILITAEGNTVRRHSAATGAVVAKNLCPEMAAQAGQLSPDGKTLLALEAAGLALFDTATGKRLQLFPVLPICWSFDPNGKVLTANYHTEQGKYWIRQWDSDTGKPRLLAAITQQPAHLAMSFDGKRLYAALDSSTLWCCDAANGKELWREETAWPGALAVSGDGKIVCSEHHLGRGPLRLWNAETGQEIGKLDAPGASHFVFSSDGEMLAAGTGSATVIWNVATEQVIRRIPLASRRLAFACDGKSLYALGDRLFCWDIKTGKQLFSDQDGGHIGAVEAVTFSPNGKLLASWGKDGTVHLWTLASKQHRVLRTDAPPGRKRNDVFSGGAAESARIPIRGIPLQFMPNGQQLLTAVAGDFLVLVDVKSAEIVRKFEDPRYPTEGTNFAATRLSEDGQRVLAMGYILPQTTTVPRPSLTSAVRVWNAETGNALPASSIQMRSEGASGFTKDGRWFIDLAANRIFDVGTGAYRTFSVFQNELKTSMGGPVVFSAAGGLLAAPSPDPVLRPADAIYVFEVLTGRELARLQGSLGYGQPLAISSDGRLVAASGHDALHIWETATGKRLLHVSAKKHSSHGIHDGFASSLCFAPDGQTLATGLANGTILLWDMKPIRKSLTRFDGSVDLNVSWKALANDDPSKAFAAMDRLASVPAKSMPLLRQHVHPEPKLNAAWLASRLADLDSSKYAVREAATRELKAQGKAVEGELRRMLENPPSLEARQRVLAILKSLVADDIAWLSPDELRLLRCITVLERMGTKDAHALLSDLAAGAPNARITQDAAAALRRLRRN